MLSANAAPTTAPAAALIVRVAPANREELLSLRAAPPPCHLQPYQRYL